MPDLVSRIAGLKKSRGAVILAHNYTLPEVQDIADFTGDSLELSLKARDAGAPVMVFCGVRFMAETAKILSPASRVLLPAPNAGCRMADMAPAEKIRAYRASHPDTLLVAYVNTTAAAKAEVDICCTSANAEKIVRSLPADKKIMFLPDRNLGANIIARTGRTMELWDGCCPVHDAVTSENLSAAAAAHPQALSMVHPECRPEVCAAADRALSTGQMLRFVKESGNNDYIVGTEGGIMHRLRRDNPGKNFFPLSAEIRCADMKEITLERIAAVLENMAPEIELPAELLSRARRPIDRMLEIK